MKCKPMIYHLNILTVLALIVLASWACRDTQELNTASNQGQDVGFEADVELLPPPDVAATAVELASARCEVVYDCCSAEERETIFGLEGETAADCSATTGAQFPGLGATGALAAAIANGNAIFHEHRAELCNDAVKGLACSEFRGDDEYILSLPGCRDIVQGLLEDGEDCQNSYECESRNCYYAELAENGVCSSLPSQEGQECRNGQCGGMTYCHPNTDLCVQKQTLDSECFWDYECNTGYCADVGNDEQRCQEPPATCSG